MNLSNNEQFFATIPDVPVSVLPPAKKADPIVSALSESTLNAVEHVYDQLDRLESLTLLLGCEDDYVIPPPLYSIPKSFRLSIVVPVFNEAATIEKVLTRLYQLPMRKEIIVVDDCSTDGTRRILQRFEKAPDFTIFYKPKNEGKGAALHTGFALATGDAVVVQDADLEYDPRDLPAVIQPLVEGDADVVYGSRFMHAEPQDKSYVHRLGNGLLTWASNAFTRMNITDMETCYKAFRRDVIQSIELKQKRFGFEPEITAKLARRRCRIQEVPISYNARSYAEGKKIGIRDLANALYCIVRYGVRD